MPHSYFSFAPCGQGLFVHGALKCPGLAALQVVFDCGTAGHQGRLSDAIHEYQTAFEGPEVLVLSHLHDDHVSGVPQLLRDHQCEAIILPYLTPLARAAAIAASESDDPSYVNLVADPVGYFTGGDRPRARRIILVAEGGEGDSRLSDVVPDEPTPPDSGSDPGSRERLIEHLAQVLERAGRKPRGDDEFAVGASAERVRIMGDEGSCRLTPCWDFRFLVRDPAAGRTAAARNAMPAQWAAFEVAVRAILGVPAGMVISTAALAAGLADPAKIDALRRAYRPLGDLNTNGLTLWIGRRQNRLGTTTLVEAGSSFLGAGNSMPSIWIGGSSAGKAWRDIIGGPGHLQNRGSGILLTADNSFEKNGQAILDHFSRELPSTGVVQVPHHGSRLSWNAGIFRAVSDAVVSPCFWPLNAGLLNRYGHPHQSVTEALEASPGAIVAANHEHAALHINISA